MLNHRTLVTKAEIVIILHHTCLESTGLTRISSYFASSILIPRVENDEQAVYDVVVSISTHGRINVANLACKQNNTACRSLPSNLRTQCSRSELIPAKNKRHSSFSYFTSYVLLSKALYYKQSKANISSITSEQIFPPVDCENSPFPFLPYPFPFLPYPFPPFPLSLPFPSRKNTNNENHKKRIISGRSNPFEPFSKGCHHPHFNSAEVLFLPHTQHSLCRERQHMK